MMGRAVEPSSRPKWGTGFSAGQPAGPSRTLQGPASRPGGEVGRLPRLGAVCRRRFRPQEAGSEHVDRFARIAESATWSREMRRRLSSAGRLVKWASTGLTVFSCLVWLPNQSMTLRYVWKGPTDGRGIWIGGGCVGYFAWVPLRSVPPSYVPPRLGASLGEPFAEDRNLWIGTSADNFLCDRICKFPASIPLAAFGLLAAILWRYDLRRFPAGHCFTCGYNLTGNVSGICPECGTPGDGGSVRVTMSR